MTIDFDKFYNFEPSEIEGTNKTLEEMQYRAGFRDAYHAIFETFIGLNEVLIKKKGAK